MKVILEAFQGKLKSEPMDFPEGTGSTINMRLDMARPPFDATRLSLSIGPIMATCRFEEQQAYRVLPDGSTARVYTLVGF